MTKRVLAGLAGLAVLTLAVRAADDTPSIKDIMTKAHKGGNALIAKVGKQVKEKDVPWEDVQKESKELVDLGKALGKNDPPKGEKKSWEKLTKEYVTNAEALQKAADDKDAKAATASHKKLAESCKSCHGAHKG